MDLGLEGKHVLITGASQGIGRALSESFAKEGARVSVTARRAEVLQEAVKEIGGQDRGHAAFSFDLMEPDAPELLCQKVIREQGPVDVVIHNLGGTLARRDLFAPSTEWQQVWRLNAGIAIDINRVLLPLMKEKSWGRAVHIVSTAADDLSGSGPYSAAKAYLKAYVQIMGRELASSGVVVSGVSPGAVATHDNVWTKKQRDNPALVSDFLSKHQAIGRLGRGEELAPFVLLLASNLATFASASVLPVHGGCM